MTNQEYNKEKCKKYYHRTKHNLTEEQIQKRKESNRQSQRRYYEKNKELCKQRTIECRDKRLLNKPKKEKVSKQNILKEKISIQKIIELKIIDFHIYISSFPKLRLWDKKIKDWTNQDYNKFKQLNLN